MDSGEHPREHWEDVIRTAIERLGIEEFNEIVIDVRAAIERDFAGAFRRFEAAKAPAAEGVKRSPR